jgi:hypothetical protein
MSVLCSAIEHRRVIGFGYRGFYRVVEPYVHGRSTAGRPVLRAYQIGGGSHSSLGWKLFALRAAHGIQVLDERFVPRREYRPEDQAMCHVHCRVATLDELRRSTW